jgi:hypothetical protein
LNILPLTTLRTIDLGGKKNSGPLFSIFCEKLRVFFEGIVAPKLVQTLKAMLERIREFPELLPGLGF